MKGFFAKKERDSARILVLSAGSAPPQPATSRHRRVDGLSTLVSFN